MEKRFSESKEGKEIEGEGRMNCYHNNCTNENMHPYVYCKYCLAHWKDHIKSRSKQKHIHCRKFSKEGCICRCKSIKQGGIQIRAEEGGIDV